MTNDKQQQQFQAKPDIPFVTNVQANFSDEFALLNVFSGNQVYRFALTPAHIKRVKLLLEKALESYEEKHGAINTQLPEARQGQEKEGSGIGFR